MQQSNICTYGMIVEYLADLSERINTIYNVQPEVFLQFNQNDEVGGSAILTYRVTDMYIELDIPQNYNILKPAHRITLTCILIHEYCHYIEALTMSGKERVNSMREYTKNYRHRRAEEQRNWTATKRLAKKLNLWTKPFYNSACKCSYTSALQF